MSEQQKLILCIDDDEDDSVWIEEAISEIDPSIDVFIKSNGKDALAFLHQLKAFGTLPCLILLDVNMPGMNGKQTLEEIKKDPDLKDIPVVILTTSGSKSEQVFFERHGAAFMTKPANFAELKRRLHQVAVPRCNSN